MKKTASEKVGLKFLSDCPPFESFRFNADDTLAGRQIVRQQIELRRRNRHAV